jgi:hypothetical protein
MKTKKHNQLEKLSGFKIANTEVLKSIVGGFKEKELDTRKRDAPSQEADGGHDLPPNYKY